MASSGWLRRLWPYLAARRRDVAMAFGAAVAGLTVAAFTPVVEKVIVDDVILGHRRPLAPWLTVLVAAGLLRFGVAHVRRYVGGRVALAVQFDLRNDVYERLQRLDFARHDEFQTGQLVSRAGSDVALVQGLLAFLPLATGNVVMLVVSLVIMAVLSPLLTLVTLVVVPLILAVTLRLRTTVFPASWDAQQRAAEVAGVVEEAVSGVRVVKGFGQEQRELANLAATAEDLFASRMRAVRIQARYGAALQALPSLGQVAVLALGGWLALHHRLSLGTFLAFSSYLLQLVAPVRMVSALTVVAQGARAGAERVFELLDSTPVVVERDGATPLPPVTGEIAFDEVRFGYLRSEPVLDGLTLTVAAGETVALVGAAGSGKSTVALLLPRFYEVQSGSVRIDGVDVRDVTLGSLRGQIGVVFEDTFLFADTARANVAFGRPGASDDDVVAAARAAEAHEFISALPEGYDTRLGEGGLTLSGGQRQRLALARALLTDPRVLVLDDATSAVDARVEEEIHATLRRVLAGRTTLLVAHRRSTLRLADRIAVLDKGRVVDTGTSEELVARCPLYRRLLAHAGPAIDEEAPADPPVPGAGDGDGRGAADGHGHGNGAAGRGPAVDGTTGVAPARSGDGDGAPSKPPLPPRVRPRVTVAAGGRTAGTGGGGGMGRGADWMGTAATPELLAALDTLPPATDRPEVDVGRAAEPEEAFTLGAFLRPHRRPLALGLALVVVDALLTLAGPVLVRTGIDRGVVAVSSRALFGAAAAFLAVVLVDWVVVWAQQRQTGRTAERLLFALRVRIFAHLQRLGIDFYEREMAGSIMTRMTTDVEALSTLLQSGVIGAVVNVLTLLGVAVVLVAMNVRLSLATATVFVPLVASTVWFRRASARAYDVARERIATVNANLQESVTGVRVVQAYARQEDSIEAFRQVAQGHLDARMRAQRLVATYFPFVELLSEVGAAVVLGVGAALVGGGGLTAGELIAFLLYLDQLFSPIQQLSQVFDTYQQARASLAQIGKLLALEPTVAAAAHPVDPGRLRGAIRFEDVRFRYPTATEEALAGVDLEISPGETVALVGETGAGKSTVLKLVARFYDPTGGRVVVDGHPLPDLDLGAFRRQLGFVPQEPFLFSGTVRDNIAYGRPEATDAEVEAAARAVGAHDFVAGLAGGYDHPVTERGRSLSSGQRQLLALARARLVDPAVLLLDEATSTLDLASEARVLAAMRLVAEGRTTVVIAHRLSTARTADRVVVVDGGQVVEEGPHADLVARGGRYAAMWAAFEGDRALAGGAH
ncbi:MAG: ABC transporter ATP-binding protein [Acidimicrobiales bacterium]